MLFKNLCNFYLLLESLNDHSIEKCCKENTVPQMCMGLCKEQNASHILGFRSGKEDIFGISNLGRCSKHLEAIHKCKEISAGNLYQLVLLIPYSVQILILYSVFKGSSINYIISIY